MTTLSRIRQWWLDTRARVLADFGLCNCRIVGAVGVPQCPVHDR